MAENTKWMSQAGYKSKTNVRTGSVGKEACIQDSCQSVMNVCVVVRCDSNPIWMSNFRYCFGGLYTNCRIRVTSCSSHLFRALFCMLKP